jgi:hypothetical protein
MKKSEWISELESEIEAQKKSQAERQARIDSWQTDIDDCFVSIRMNDINQRLSEARLHIVQNNGLATFNAWFDQEGKEVDVRWVKTRFGYNTYALVGRGIFASSEKALAKKTGWVMKKIQAPAWAKIVAGGSGMYGAFNSSVSIYRISENKITEVDC